MSHYHFHLQNGGGFVEDEEGRELPGPEEARVEAVRDIRSIISEEVREGVVVLRGRLEVVDGDGAPILTVAFSDAVEIRD